MFITKNKNNIEAESRKAINEIKKWCSGRDRYLNIISVPYNSSDFLSEIILEFVSNNKKVIYITNECDEKIEVIEVIKKRSEFKEYYFYRNNNYLDKMLTVCHTSSACDINSRFDLVIFNDINGFPELDNKQIAKMINKLVSYSGKAICYSIDQIFLDGSSVTFPADEDKMPICEPRIITTRVDIEKELPYVVYDYINWFIVSNRKVIMYTPDGDKVLKIYNYLFYFRRKLNVNLNYYIEEKVQCSPKMINRFVEQKSGILITDCYDRLCLCMEDVDVIVFFADNEKFTYKQLVYFCNKTKRGDKFKGGEVLFLANVNTTDMDEAKEITRNFNKEAWEKGLINT